MTGISSSWPPAEFISSRMICTTFSCTRQPAGRNDHKPAPSWRTSPARTISLCDSASASAGACCSVGRKYVDRRVMEWGEPSDTSLFEPFGSPDHGRTRMAYEVPPLPYDAAALEPHIDAQTMQLHHDKHHQAYVDKANAALQGT